MRARETAESGGSFLDLPITMYPAIYALLALGTVPVLAVILVLLSPFSPIMGFYGRLLASYLCLLICSTYGVLASIVLRLLGYPGLSQWAVGRAFKHTMSLTTGIRFPIINAEHLTTRPAVFIGNHQTELDVLMLGSIFPPYCSVTAKSSLARVPVLGWFMTLSGTVFIDRADRGKAMTAFESAAKHMKEGRQSVFIFPEGTRSYAKGPEMLPFKKGAFHLAVKAGVPIVPVVTANYAGVLDTSRRIFTAGNVPVVGEQAGRDDTRVG